MVNLYVLATLCHTLILGTVTASAPPPGRTLPIGPRAPQVVPIKPTLRWSWDRIPTSFQGAKKERAFTELEVRRLAKYQMLTPEKWYTPCASKGPQQSGPSCDIENRTLELFKLLKALNPDQIRIFYWNTMLDFSFYAAHAQMLEMEAAGLPSFLRDERGEVMRLCNDGNVYCNVTTFDWTQPHVRQLWIDQVVNITRSGLVDGIFADHSADIGIHIGAGSINPKQGRNQLCNGQGPEFRCYNFTTEFTDSFNSWHAWCTNYTQNILANSTKGPVIQGPYAEAEFRAAGDVCSFDDMRAFAQNGKGNIFTIQAPAGHGDRPDKRGINSCKPDETCLAAFLTAAEPYMYMYCQWDEGEDLMSETTFPEMDYHLGNPEGPAVEVSPNVWRRRFGGNATAEPTVVFWDNNRKTGNISWAGVPPPPPSGCVDPYRSCSLNGVCSDEGDCECYSGWSGAACETLAMLPTPRLARAAAYGGDSQTPNVSSWGGNALLGDDGQWHLWVSEFVNGCGLSSWLSNSVITHAVAPNATGPFVKADRALGIFSHNVMPLRAPPSFGTGARPYYLFHLGNGISGPLLPSGSPGGSVANCTREASGSDVHTMNAPPVNSSNLAHRASSPNGPWYPIPNFEIGPRESCNNPAPLWHPNGTLFLLCNAGNTGRPWPLFSSPNGGFTWDQVRSIRFPLSWITVRSPPYQGTEDPFLFLDKNRHWHMLTHRYRFSDGPGATSVLVAGHAFSRDGLEWQFSDAAPYSNIIEHTSGPPTTYTSLERPHLIIDEATLEPTHLVLAASPAFSQPLCSRCATRLPEFNSSCVLCKLTPGVDSTFTMVLPLGQYTNGGASIVSST
eukprot:CAMPEP_0206291816 /NCGR_PEP_ID=MMETSP0106_2-20121207/3311_1 /ASSEMBLY_ACC=CAM_ASM_000206 /TAXON_ID=81532 /ORGANISM="Acanthoeca-like sp., Strain 10tr" /LENGTH=841 /DNA_ID=CAMNT_0053722381 /DNA_START=158 /DNA_END=2683 /DNA_ORIENTATION=-